ncbi:hypothetical protein DVH24_033950 [Malus domestica]|uniref:Uncharacterized protein n=1 Tax=Malus domestica TaxID=3750 RepID=A0A498KWM9_MALDO|nr:hypothetical protein DVH24_033950 [Malus domestica]
MAGERNICDCRDLSQDLDPYKRLVLFFFLYFDCLFKGFIPLFNLFERMHAKIFMFRFILVDRGGARKSSSGFVSMNVDGSRHPLPLTTVYRYVHPVDAQRQLA